MIEIKRDGNGVKVMVAGSYEDIQLEIKALVRTLTENEKTTEMLINSLEEVASDND